ncbi:C-terminal processing protease CtpA/Prc [Sphingomonas kaistensis]|uniref:C-terminal processing protease CtpA/Prc n=1 Tax=Sphingomonas kaistensis TaxID=298708 RepID=A0A7X5Y4G1_9SPHN|nr:S41 family peptidase [Sphingomonas kaistensis]NJC04906.1 C-terminal processing protease CtpA/Prc [Sphingomonas kaistensis]
MRQISRLRQVSSLLCISVLLSSCGGGDGATPDSAGTPPVIVTPPPTTPPTNTACSLTSRLEWVQARLKEDYLNPDLLANISPAGYTDIQQYINDLTAPARAAGKDKLNFSYVTSIAEETALTNSGSSAGLGVRLYTEGSRLFISEAFEGAPGLAAGLDRGVEILAIGTSASTLQNVSDLIASGGLSAALGPSEPGVTRTFRIRSVSGVESVITATKADYALDPVSDRYGGKILTDGGKKVGYVNLRTFIVANADQQLRTVFADFKAQGVTEVIIDLRYNGGGLVSLAETLTNLLGANRTSSDIQSKTVFNARLSSNNRTTYFAPQTQSIAPTKIAFIGGPATASASELVMNALIPYYGANVGLIGANTYGKPVGQIARDRAECDDRFRIIAFQTVNRDNNGDYFNGLASSFQRTCRATDDLTRQLGDPTETSIKTALDFLAGRSCTAITGGISSLSVGEGRALLQSPTPTSAQREVPGLF